MFVTCNSILKLPSLENMKVVAGKGGLDRIIKWVHVMEQPNYSEWLKGGELLLTTGVVIKNDEEALLKFVKDLNLRKLSGLVINVGPYIPKTPEKVIQLADSLDFPIFELPFEIGLIDVCQNVLRMIFMNKLEQDSMDNFMKEVILGHMVINEEILSRAVYYGYDNGKKYCAFVIQLSNYTDFEIDDINYEERILQIKQQVEQIIGTVLKKINKKKIYTMQGDSIIVMVPVEKSDEDVKVLDSIAEEIIVKVKTKLEHLEIKIGIGSPYFDLKDFKTSVEEGRKALKVLKSSDGKGKISNYNRLGIFRIFFQINDYEELNKIYYGTLGKLIEYDKKNGTELISTLEAYINEDGKLDNVADALFIHRNTLKYRAQRIEEILGCSLKNERELFNMNVALKVGHFLRCV